MQKSGRARASFAGFLLSICSPLTGVLGRVLLVVGASACGLLLLDALFGCLAWVIARDRHALADAAGFLAAAAVAFTLTAAGAYGRERLRRALKARPERTLAEFRPWARQAHRRAPLMLEHAALGRGNNFDALRLLAAVAVLVSNSFPITYGASGVQPLATLSRGQTSLGMMAVLVFFVISGYLVTQSFDRRPVPLRFLKARVLRIFPALTVALVLTAGVLGAAVTPLSLAEYFTRFDTSQYVYGGLSLVWMQYDLPGVFEGNPAGAVVNGSLWTLYYEFLMCLVVLALGTARLLNRRVVLALWLGTLVLSWRWIGETYVASGAPFLSGAVLYLWRDRVPLDWCLALLCVVALGGAMAIGGFGLAFATFGAYLVLYLALAPSVRLPGLARWGNLSYGIYIFAWPVQQTAVLLLGSAATWYWTTALSLPAILALAWLSWHLVERPALSLKRSEAMARTVQH